MRHVTHMNEACHTFVYWHVHQKGGSTTVFKCILVHWKTMVLPPFSLVKRPLVFGVWSLVFDCLWQSVVFALWSLNPRESCIHWKNTRESLFFNTRESLHSFKQHSRPCIHLNNTRESWSLASIHTTLVSHSFIQHSWDHRPRLASVL